MDIWQRARTFAEDAAKRSQELTKEAAKRSQDFSIGSSKLSDIVSEASKRSKEIAAEASKRADFIKVEALKRADQIKAQIPPAAAALSNLVDGSAPAVGPADDVDKEDLETFGVTDELREFVKDITLNTFQDFPLQDDTEVSDVPTVSNVRQDLTKWQEVHAKLVLSTVKEISKLRYELCPRVMKERKFWRIYFILVNSHVAPYETRYMEESKRKSATEAQNDVKDRSTAATISKTEAEGVSQKSKSVSSSATEQDLDVFLLGDLGDSDDGPDDADEKFDDDDFDKL